ncbi:MAG: hypothetical protein GY764_13055, partial [Halieaceae bacterium]|nr:hypothetical protein [Halieaceae bacterium]
PHAASNYRHLRYCYDANGNATVRLAGGILYALQYDPENRLSVVSVMDSAPATIARSNADVYLTWSPVSGAGDYEVWRSSQPYFSPGDENSEKIATKTGTSHIDGNHIGDVSSNYTYLIIALDEESCPLGVSKRLGEFDFALVSGSAAGSQTDFFTQPLYLPDETLAPIALGSTVIAEYTYDGDGNRVKAVVNGETT